MAQAVLYQDAVARWAGMHATDLQCAGMLVTHGPMTASELAGRAGLTTGGAITAVIDRLERAGFAERRRDDQDRRRVLVVPNHAALFERVGPVYRQVGETWAKYLDGLTDDQLALVTDALEHAAELNRAQAERLRERPRPSP